MTRMNKSQASALVRAGRVTEVFHHTSLGIFNVSELRLMVQREPGRWPVRVSAITPHLVRTLEEHDLDLARCAELDGMDLAQPAFLVSFPDGSVPVDGTHRIYRRHQLGLRDFLFRMFLPEEVPMVPEGAGVAVPWGEKEVVGGRLRKVGAP